MTFEILKTDIKPTPGDEDKIVDMELQLDEELGARQLHIHLDYIRGRCLKTTITIEKDGKCRLHTHNRGEALTRWVDLLRGKKFLSAV